MLAPILGATTGGILAARLVGTAVLLAAPSVVGFRRRNVLLIAPVLLSELVVAPPATRLDTIFGGNGA